MSLHPFQPIRVFFLPNTLINLGTKFFSSQQGFLQVQTISVVFWSMLKNLGETLQIVFIKLVKAIVYYLQFTFLIRSGYFVMRCIGLIKKELNGKF